MLLSRGFSASSKAGRQQTMVLLPKRVSFDPLTVLGGYDRVRLHCQFGLNKGFPQNPFLESIISEGNQGILGGIQFVDANIFK